MAAGCGPLSPRDKGPDEVEKQSDGAGPVEAPEGFADVAVVAMERAQRGGRLVFIDRRGNRIEDLTRIGPVPVRDNSPVWSPDRAWIVFVSSRGRNTLVDSSLWLVPARPGAQPRRLTHEASVDRDPAWTPDGRAIVFASDRGGSFDLWRLDLTMDAAQPVPAGPPVQLTSGPEHDLHPSPAPDGKRIAYMQVAADASRSSLKIWQDGASRPLTEGPADMTPAWSPDGSRVAFAAPSPDGDADLYTVDPDGAGRSLVAREPLADQTGPVWSADSRILFSTSVYRSVATGKPILSSITFFDLGESPTVLRALHDMAAVASRASPAPIPAALDPAGMSSNLSYKEALKRAIEQELAGEPSP